VQLQGATAAAPAGVAIGSGAGASAKAPLIALELLQDPSEPTTAGTAAGEGAALGSPPAPEGGDTPLAVAEQQQLFAAAEGAEQGVGLVAAGTASDETDIPEGLLPAGEEVVIRELETTEEGEGVAAEGGSAPTGVTTLENKGDTAQELVPAGEVAAAGVTVTVMLGGSAQPAGAPEKAAVAWVAGGDGGDGGDGNYLLAAAKGTAIEADGWPPGGPQKGGDPVAAAAEKLRMLSPQTAPGQRMG
jgi:hypothetical protein